MVLDQLIFFVQNDGFRPIDLFSDQSLIDSIKTDQTGQEPFEHFQKS